VRVAREKSKSAIIIGVFSLYNQKQPRLRLSSSSEDEDSFSCDSFWLDNEKTPHVSRTSSRMNGSIN